MNDIQPIQWVCDDCFLVVCNGPERDTLPRAMSKLSGMWCYIGHWYDEQERCDECPEFVSNCCHADAEANKEWACPGCGNVPGAFATQYEIQRVSYGA